MDFKSLEPIFYSSAAFLLTILSIGLRKRGRIIALVPIWAFIILALASVRQLTWPIGVDAVMASILSHHLAMSIKNLVLEEHAVNAEVSKRPWSFVDCYRTCVNPRGLPVRLSHLDEATSFRRPTRLAFFLRRATRATVLFAIDKLAIQPLVLSVLSGAVVTDFSPKMELMPPWAIFQPYLHQVQIRLIMSIHWIWGTYFFLEFYNSLLAIICVTILCLDQPGDWPPLFGSAMEMCSVRRFWGRFWHKIPTQIYAFYALLVSRKLMGLKPGSRIEKTFLSMFVFTVSGLFHCLIDWLLRDAGGSRDLLFFEMNFLVISLEVAVSKGIIGSKSILPLPSALRKAVGMMWVYLWFFSVVPMWSYPKFRHQWSAGM